MSARRRGKANIRAAETATDEAEKCWQLIYAAVHAPRWTNGYGVYDQRADVITALLEIDEQARKALTILRAHDDWPNNEDYDAAERGR